MKATMQLSAQTTKSVHRPSVVARVSRISQPVVARFGGRGNVLDRPDVEIKQGGGFNSDSNTDVETPKTETDQGSGGTDRQRGTPPGGGNYRLLLLKSPSHTEQGVVRALTSVVPNTDKDHAKNCYSTSLTLGMALVTSVMKEHAEHYNMQLYRMGCKTAIEPDNTTV